MDSALVMACYSEAADADRVSRPLDVGHAGEQRMVVIRTRLTELL